MCYAPWPPRGHGASAPCKLVTSCDRQISMAPRPRDNRPPVPPHPPLFFTMKLRTTKMEPAEPRTETPRFTGKLGIAKTDPTGSDTDPIGLRDLKLCENPIFYRKTPLLYGCTLRHPVNGSDRIRRRIRRRTPIFTGHHGVRVGTLILKLKNKSQPDRIR